MFEAAGIQSEGHMVSHRLRATFAVDLLQKGVPLEHVSKLLGHKSATTTENAIMRSGARVDSNCWTPWSPLRGQRRKSASRLPSSNPWFATVFALVPVVLLLEIFFGVCRSTQSFHRNSKFLAASSTDRNYRRAGKPFDHAKAGLLHAR